MMSKCLPFAMLLVMGAVACGAPQPPSAGPEAGEGQPKYGGAINLRMTRDMWQFDMSYEGQSPPNDRGIRLAYNSLLGFKAGPDVSYNDFVLQPEIAERWEVGPEARSFTFQLRKGVRFANLAPANGRDVTAQDVKWSYEYLARTGQFKDAKLPQSQFEWMFEGLEGVDTPDPYTVRVRFKEGFAPFLSYAAHKLNPLMAREIYEQDGHLKDRMVGSGPYQWDSDATQRGTRWVFKKNKDYFDAGKPYGDEVRVLVLADDAAANAAFQTKLLDFLSVDEAQAAEDLQKKTPSARSLEVLRNPRYLLTHTRRPPLNDGRIRKALSLSIDRDEFIRILSNGKGAWGLAGTNAWSELFTQEETKQIYRHDPQEARRLVAEAGFPNGVDISFNYATDRGQQGITVVELLQAQLKKGNINLVPRPMTYADLTTLRKKHDFQMDNYSEFPRPDPDGALYATFHPGARSNYNEVDDPKLTELVMAQRREGDPAKRRELIRAAVRYANENFYGIAVDRSVTTFFWHAHVKGFYPQQDHGSSGDLAAALAWLDR